MPSAAPGPAVSDLAALADQCVMCGLCLPHCPTYRLTGHEAESPRGRIALGRALASGAIEPTTTALAHLEHCVGCLSCEKVCPSEVRYEAIMVETRALIRERAAETAAVRPRWVDRMLARPRGSVALARLAAVLKVGSWGSRMAGWFPDGSTLQRLLREAPRAPERFVATRAPKAPPATSRRRVGLFAGCVATVFDRDTHAAAELLLERLGYEVVRGSREHCCGALARHAGMTEAASDCASAARNAFPRDLDTLLVSASGCLGTARDFAFSDRPTRVVDIVAFIATEPGFASLQFRPLPQRAALHVPCTQFTVGSGAAPIRALLARIPELDVVALPDQPRCCGAAGSYFIEQAAFADALRAERVATIDALAPNLVVTTNVGCRLFLDNALRRGLHPPTVLHPVTLLARQLADV